MYEVQDNRYLVKATVGGEESLVSPSNSFAVLETLVVGTAEIRK